jgi:hypothetical protein
MKVTVLEIKIIQCRGKDNIQQTEMVLTIGRVSASSTDTIQLLYESTNDPNTLSIGSGQSRRTTSHDSLQRCEPFPPLILFVRICLTIYAAMLAMREFIYNITTFF